MVIPASLTTDAVLAIGQQILRTMPTVFKYIVYLLLALNIKSFPLVWHYRVFRPVFKFHLQHTYVKLMNLVTFKSKAASRRREAEWFESLIPLGANPFELMGTFKSRASIDESDFNWHLSNSSYAKTMDSTRFKFGLEMWPNFFRLGGWVPLSATHFHYLREIPMLSKYEVRATVGAWDQKWLYVVQRFVTYPKKKASRPIKLNGKQNGNGDAASTPDINESGSLPYIRANMRQPVSQTEINTPAQGLSSAPSSVDLAGLSSADEKANLSAVSAELMKGLDVLDEEDGAVVNTIAISQVCFKIGRITIPPAVVMAMNGASGLSTSSRRKRYTLDEHRRVAPAYWPKIQEMMTPPGDTRDRKSVV